jgi:choline dehydrogenase-like flavoprotein
VLIDALSLAPDASVETDLCIAGAGAAGIAIAREMIGRKLRVCLLEGGGLTPDDATQSLYRGTSMARKYFPLDATRTRYFGGSTNCWSGFCRPLDADDFEQRDWIPTAAGPSTGPRSCPTTGAPRRSASSVRFAIRATNARASAGHC